MKGIFIEKKYKESFDGIDEMMFNGYTYGKEYELKKFTETHIDWKNFKKTRRVVKTHYKVENDKGLALRLPRELFKII